MFTPPPSPRPSPLKETDPFEKFQVENSLPSSAEDAKRITGRKMRWAVLIVPLVLILVAASTRYDAVFDLLSRPSNMDGAVLQREHHKRSPQPQTDTSSGIVFPTSPSSSTSGSDSASTATTTSQGLPTIPTSPPVLPTPFPQPFDTSLGSNFSTVGCKDFFLNMTSTTPFRECRPFSLLLQSSSAFITAQQNITVLNNIIWGTCNTDPGSDQCTANMAWFASSLQSACKVDLDDLNASAVDTLRALQAYALMLNTGCTTDPATSSYCYVSAALDPNPSDIYFYELPLGINLPNKTSISCSACTKSLMSLYDAALTGSTRQSLTGLQKTYDNAAALTIAQCGTAFAQRTNTGGAAGLHVGVVGVLGAVVALLAGWSISP